MGAPDNGWRGASFDRLTAGRTAPKEAAVERETALVAAATISVLQRNKQGSAGYRYHAPLASRCRRGCCSQSLKETSISTSVFGVPSAIMLVNCQREKRFRRRAPLWIHDDKRSDVDGNPVATFREKRVRGRGK